LGFGVCGIEFRVQGLGFRVSGLGLRSWGLWIGFGVNRDTVVAELEGALRRRACHLNNKGSESGPRRAVHLSRHKWPRRRHVLSSQVQDNERTAVERTWHI